MPNRGPTQFVYRHHVTGTINGVTIDKKYPSYTAFLEEWGGTATPLKLNRQKLTRLNGGFYDDKSQRKSNDLLKKLYGLKFTPIHEKRPYVRKVTKKLVEEPAPVPVPVSIDSEPEDDEPAPAPAPAPSPEQLDAYEGVTFEVLA